MVGTCIHHSMVVLNLHIEGKKPPQGAMHDRERTSRFAGPALPESLVWPSLVVVLKELLQHPLQVPPPQIPVFIIHQGRGWSITQGTLVSGCFSFHY